MNTRALFILIALCFVGITGCGSNSKSGQLLSERLQVEHRLDRQMERNQVRAQQRVRGRTPRPAWKNQPRSNELQPILIPGNGGKVNTLAGQIN